MKHAHAFIMIMTGYVVSAGVTLAAQPMTVGNARVTQPPPGVNIAAGYLDIRDDGTGTVHLTGVSSARFRNIEMHETVMDGGVASMHRLAGVMIGPGTTFSFAPGGAHLMLYDAAPPLKLDELVDLTLHFADETTLDARARVVPIAAPGEHAH